MDYINYQDEKIRKIAAGYQGWYKAKSSVWGERYIKEKEDVESVIKKQFIVFAQESVVKHIDKNFMK